MFIYSCHAYSWSGIIPSLRWLLHPTSAHPPASINPCIHIVIFLYMHVCVHLYMSLSRHLAYSLSLSLYIYIYIYIWISSLSII